MIMLKVESVVVLDIVEWVQKWGNEMNELVGVC